MHKKIIPLLLIVLLQTAKTNAQDQAMSLTLQQAIDYALKNNLLVKNAANDEKNADYKVKEVTSMGLPQINASFDVKDFIDIPTSLVPAEFFGGPPGTFFGVQFGTQYNATASVEASQLLFEGAYIVGLQASKLVREIARINTKRTQIETAVAVSKAYYNVLIMEERILLLDKNEQQLKKLFDDTKVLLQNGFVEQLDVDRIAVAYNNFLVEKEKVIKLKDISYALLKFQMGLTQSTTVTLSDKLENIAFQSPSDFGKASYNNRSEYLMAQSNVQASKLMLKKDRFSYLPNAVLYGSVMANAMRNEFDIFDTSKGWYPTTVVGFRVGVPIFSSGMRHYKVQQSKVSLYKSENELLLLQSSLELEIISTSSMLDAASKTLNTRKENILLAESVYKIAKAKYDQGVGSNLEVLNAETALKEAQTNYFSALYEALVAKIEYEKSTGNILK